MIYRNERDAAEVAALIAALEGWQGNIWTALPAIIENVDFAKRTVSAQPSVRMRRQLRDGTYAWVTMPVLINVPILYPSGGGFTLTFPVKQGDEALIIFSSRSFDYTWLNGGVQNQAELCMHDLSDGFALVGWNSLPNVIPSISQDSVQLRSDDGQAYVEVAGGHVVNVISPSAINITAPNVNINATAQLTVDSPQQKNTGDITDNYISNDRTMAGMRTIYNEHTHPDPQGGDTGVPNEQM